jgi:hypothetical protein
MGLLSENIAEKDKAFLFLFKFSFMITTVKHEACNWKLSFEIPFLRKLKLTLFLQIKTFFIQPH